MYLMNVRFVTLKRFEAMTGYTVKAVRAKISGGVWLMGREYVKAPDGHILVDLEGYERWVLGEAGGTMLPARTPARAATKR